VVYVPDLSVFRYHEGPFDPQNWAVPLRYVGWLVHGQKFTTGNVNVTVLSKLGSLVKQTRSAYPGSTFLGVERCSSCAASRVPGPGPVWSQENIFVPGINTVYVSPGGIVHYIEAHSYLPPTDFLEAVSRCPDCGSDEYRAALRLANGGSKPPLSSDKDLAEWVHRLKLRTPSKTP